MAEALLDFAVVPARTGILPPRRGSGTSGGGFPVIVPVPPAGPSEVPVRASVPPRGSRVPAPRDGEQAPVGQDGEGAVETAVVAGTTVDHLTETYQAHYRSLLGPAALLLD
ncbi:SigE family RNA polymerase sigma factor, partial [Streptomyces xanthophaeus]